jgi:hypothetical protein
MKILRKLHYIIGIIMSFGNLTPVNVQAYDSTPSQNQVIGVIDSVVAVVTKKNKRAMQVNGWACAAYNNASIDVHIYGQGPYSSLLIGSGKTKLSNEEGVAIACHTPTTKRHRFSITITSSSNMRVSRDNGYTVVVYGIDPTGVANLPLDNSELFPVTY